MLCALVFSSSAYDNKETFLFVIQNCILILKIKLYHSPFLYLQKLNTNIIILITVKGRDASYSNPTKNNIMHLQPQKVILQVILLGIIHYNTSKCNKQISQAHWRPSNILAFSTSMCSVLSIDNLRNSTLVFQTVYKVFAIGIQNRDRHSYLQLFFLKNLSYEIPA